MRRRWLRPSLLSEANFVPLKNSELYKPAIRISVDEGMIGFKGRLSFRQYMPAKPTKYGIKVWMAADASNGFVVNHKVYLGKQPRRVLANGLGYSVVMELMAPLLNKNHHVYFDNFFSSRGEGRNDL